MLIAQSSKYSLILHKRQTLDWFWFVEGSIKTISRCSLKIKSHAFVFITLVWLLHLTLSAGVQLIGGNVLIPHGPLLPFLCVASLQRSFTMSHFGSKVASWWWRCWWLTNYYYYFVVACRVERRLLLRCFHSVEPDDHWTLSCKSAGKHTVSFMCKQFSPNLTPS